MKHNYAALLHMGVDVERAKWMSDWSGAAHIDTLGSAHGNVTCALPRHARLHHEARGTCREEADGQNCARRAGDHMWIAGAGRKEMLSEIWGPRCEQV